MSLSTPRLENPAKMFIDWSGDIQINSWKRWDKETKKNVFYNGTPLDIIILDQLNTVTGFNEKEQIGIYSNEVKFTNEPMDVRTFKGGTIAKGAWKEIKEQVESKGGKFTKSVYAGLITPDGLLLVNIKMHGSALDAWFEAKFKEDGHTIRLLNGNESSQKTKGRNTYYCPRFERLDKDERLFNIAMEMDKELQAYLIKYFNKNVEKAVNDEPPMPTEPPPADNSELPF